MGERKAGAAERLLAAIQAGIYQLDASGRILRANAAARQMLGFHLDDQGQLKPTAEATDEQGQSLAPAAWPEALCLATHEAQPDLTVGYRVGSGPVIWALSRAAPMLDDEGEWGALVTLVDISPRKALETERAALQARLAHADRLANVGSLATGVAQEISAPLSFVIQRLGEALGMAGGVGPAADPVAERVHQALDAARRIRHIVRDLSSFASAEPGPSAPISVNAALEAAIRMARHEVRGRAQLSRDLGRVPLIKADPGRVTQVFLNLLLNAARAIPEGDVEHHVVSLRSWAVGDEIRVEVRDTGPGLEAEAAARLLDPFGDHERGQGLSICHETVTDLGGRLEVVSTPGVGTSVRVCLPAGTEEGFEPMFTPAPFRVSLPPERVADSPPRLLVVDDQQPVRRALARMLARHFVVDQAASIAEVHECVARHADYDLVLCDMMLLDGSGAEIHAWLSERHPALATRMIFMTGGVFSQAGRAFLESREHAWLEKPFRVSEVLRAYEALGAPRGEAGPG